MEMKISNRMVAFLCFFLINILLSNANPRKDYRTLVRNPCNCLTTFEYSPICGSNGETYVNSGALVCKNKCDNSNIHEVHDGECQPKSDFHPIKNPGPSGLRPSCNCAVTLTYSPVCGSDGRTYSNSRYLTCNNKCYGTNIHIARHGKCKKY